MVDVETEKNHAWFHHHQRNVVQKRTLWYQVRVLSVSIPGAKKTRHLAYFLPQRLPSTDGHQVHPDVKL